MLLAIYFTMGALAIECQSGEAAANQCTPDKCESVGNAQICTDCQTGNVPINGVCADATASEANCKNKVGDSKADQTCGQCLNSYFMFKGGCYDSTQGVGKTLCTAASTGVCTQGAEGYFAIPGATKTDQSVVACGDTTGVTVDTNKKYIGIENCAKCTKPDQLLAPGTKAATCTECDSGKIVKTAAGVTSCVTEAQCTGTEGFFVKDGTPKTCIACSENCKTCSGGNEADKCTSCKTDTPYLKKTDNSQTGTCVNAADCTNDSTYYADDTVDPTSGKLCRKCAEGGLKDCEKSADDLVCKECTGKKFGLNKKSCVTECPDNASEKSGVCTCNDGFTPSTDSTVCVATSSSVNLSTGAIAGISVAAVVVVGGLVGFLCWWFICRGKA